MRRERLKTTGAAVLFASALVVAAAGLSEGLQSSLSDRSDATMLPSGGTVKLDVGNSSDQTFQLSVSDMLPGQTRDVYFTVNNSGSLQFDRVDAVLSATGSLIDSPTPSRTYEAVGADGKVKTVDRFVSLLSLRFGDILI